MTSGNVRKGRPDFLRFARLIAAGDVEKVTLRLEANPELATVAETVGATREGADEFFLRDIAHYLYGGDTALHVAAAAFRRPIAELLVAHGADVRATNRRG